MNRQAHLVGVAQVGDGVGGIDNQGSLDGGAEMRTDQRLAVVGEADEAEGGVSEGGESPPTSNASFCSICKF